MKGNSAKFYDKAYSDYGSVLRAGEISQAINNRLIDALARADDSRTVQELTTTIQQPV